MTLTDLELLSQGLGDLAFKAEHFRSCYSDAPDLDTASSKLRDIFSQVLADKANRILREKQDAMWKRGEATLVPSNALKKMQDELAELRKLKEEVEKARKVVLVKKNGENLAWVDGAVLADTTGIEFTHTARLVDIKEIKNES